MTLDYRSVLRADGDARALGNAGKEETKGTGFPESPVLVQTRACDKQACFVTPLYSATAGLGGMSLAIVNKASAFAEECALRDIIVSRLPVPQSCKEPRIIIGADRLAQSGAQFLYLHKGDEQGLFGRLKQYYFDIVETVDTEAASGQGGNPQWWIEANAALPVGKRPWMPERR